MNQQSSPLASAPRHRVLVVDDDRDFADSLGNLLVLEGYEVETAFTLAEALEALDRVAVEVVLIDIRLGDQDGLALLSELRQRCADVICVIMTAYASVESAIQALQEGAYDFLCKPFYPEDLIATLERCFERIALTRAREAAERALRIRNEELESLNARLKRVVTSMRALSTCTTLQALYATAIEALAHDRGARNAALYLVDGQEFALHHALLPGLPARITLPEGEHAPGRPVFPICAATAPLPAAGDEAACAPAAATQMSLLGFPLTGEGPKPMGLWVLQTDLETGSSEQEHELGFILASFGNEAVRLLQALDKVRWNESRLREIIDNSPSLIALNDQQGRFLVVNRQFEAWHGRTADEVVGKSSDDVFSPEIASLYKSRAVPALAGGKIVEEEIELTFHDGSAHALLVTRFPVRDVAGRPIGVGTIASDVTDRRRVEERLRHAQKMEALGQLTGGIAHDFNNLLAVIIGNLDLLRESLGGRGADRELLEDSLSSAASGRELIHRLLAFGRRQRLHPESIDVNEMVIGLSRVLERTLGKAVEIRWMLARGLWPITIDKSQFETCMLNLVLNARDAMPHGGLITIETKNTVAEHLCLGGQETIVPGRYVTLTVRDTGTGMTPAVAARAVQPFFTTKEPGDGSGLGLSMVYGFVKQSEGSLLIDSTPDQGTSVTLYFPRAAVEAKRADRPSEDDLGLSARGEHVLVVEDKPSVRKMAKSLLTRLGYSVVDAEDGSKAIALLRRTPRIDLLLTDILLTRQLNGFDLAREARRCCPGLKVLFMSGYADFPSLRSEELGTDLLILEKPFTKEALARKVRQALAG